MKKIAAAILALTLAVGLTACRSPETPSKDPSGISDGASNAPDISDPDSPGGDIKSDNTQNEAVNFVREKYNVTLPIISAKEALEITKLDLPELINGHEFRIEQLIDEKTLIVSLFDRAGASGIEYGTGLYNIESKEYSPLPGLPFDGYSAWNGDYIVYKEYDGDFTIQADDNSVKLYLYDINARENKLIFTYSFDRQFELYGGHWQNNIVLFDNKIYFDDFIKGDGDPDWRAILYSYDISTGKLEKIEEDAQNPHEYKGSILYFKLNDGSYNLICSTDGKFEFNANKGITEITALENGIFTLNVLSNDDEKRETTWGIKNLLTDECILTTTRTISDLNSGDNFLAFTDFGSNFPPTLYSVEDNSFIVFDDLIAKQYAVWYFCGETGALRVSGEDHTIYMFKPPAGSTGSARI